MHSPTFTDMPETQQEMLDHPELFLETLDVLCSHMVGEIWKGRSSGELSMMLSPLSPQAYTQDS